MYFANEGVEALGFANELTVDGDGWAQLAPYGDFPGEALIPDGRGGWKKEPAIQRVDRQIAEAVVEKFRSPWGRLKRFVTGCQIYDGHPDVPAIANAYPDGTSKGMITDLEARDTGLYCRPVFTPEGLDLVASRRARALSGYWTAQPTGGRTPDGKVIFAISEVRSAGLTNHPRLPVEMMNSHPPAQPETQPDPQPMNKYLISLLRLFGVELANDATPEQAHQGVLRAVFANMAGLAERVKAALEALNARRAENGEDTLSLESLAQAAGVEPAQLSGEGAPLTDEQVGALAQALGISAEDLTSGMEKKEEMANEDTAARNAEGEGTDPAITQRIEALEGQITQLQTGFANERGARVALLLDQAIRDGRIEKGNRQAWEDKFTADFANAETELAAQTPRMKTAPATQDLGDRKVAIANEADRRVKVQSLVADKMKAGLDYDAAFGAVRKENPALFDAMKQPGKTA